MGYQNILVEEENEILYITIDRPSKLNALNRDTIQELHEAFSEAKDDDENLFKNEAADLMYHYLILLKAKGFKLIDVENILKDRAR